MNGLISLAGSGEYLPVMDDVDKYLLANCGANGRRPRVVCMATAAGQEGDESINRWSKMGKEHFTRLGTDVQALRVIDVESANEPDHAKAVEEADLIYFSGGSPRYLFETLKDSLVWKAVQTACARGAVYAGCSASAMILAKKIPGSRSITFTPVEAFGIVGANYIFPHFDAFPFWHPVIAVMRRSLKKNEVIIGVDENTSMVGKLNEEWTVMGRSQVHVFSKADVKDYAAGEKFSIG